MYPSTMSNYHTSRALANLVAGNQGLCVTPTCTAFIVNPGPATHFAADMKLEAKWTYYLKSELLRRIY